jgi:hypothetical protein
VWFTLFWKCRLISSTFIFEAVERGPLNGNILCEAAGGNSGWFSCCSPFHMVNDPHFITINCEKTVITTLLSKKNYREQVAQWDVKALQTLIACSFQILEKTWKFVAERGRSPFLLFRLIETDVTEIILLLTEGNPLISVAGSGRGRGSV